VVGVPTVHAVAPTGNGENHPGDHHI